MQSESLHTSPPVCAGFAPPPSVVDRSYNLRYIRQPPRSHAASQQLSEAPASSQQHEDIYLHFHNNGSVLISKQRRPLRFSSALSQLGQPPQPAAPR